MCGVDPVVIRRISDPDGRPNQLLKDFTAGKRDNYGFQVSSN